MMERLLLSVIILAASAWAFAEPPSGSPASTTGFNIYCEDNAPFQFLEKDGTLTGMSVELVREIQKRVGNTDTIYVVPWARGLVYLDNEPNTILFSMGRTAERNDQYQWIGPLAENAYGFYVKANSTLDIKSLDDAKKIDLIGVYRGDVREKFLAKTGFTNLDPASNNVANFKKLMANRVAAYASSASTIQSEAEQAGYKVSDVKLAYVFLRIQLFIAASKATDPATVAHWNAALESMKKDGSFKGIFKKYYPNSALPGPAITSF